MSVRVMPQFDATAKMDYTSIARALTWHYVIALFLVATLSAAAWISLHLVISEQKSTAAVVNVSGRQRMLSQRAALFSNLLLNTPIAERALIRGKLRDTIELMARSHRGLTHGDNAMGLPETMSPTVHSMYFDGSNALDVQVETYIKTVRELLLLDDNALTPENPLLQYITKTALTTLVTALDQMVRQYQLEGEASVSRLQKAETIFWVLTLLLLMLEALLIFNPFVRHVRAIIGKLQLVTDELQLHQGNLEELVRQRTAELESRSEALAENEEKLRGLYELSPLGIALTDMEGRYVEFNNAFQNICGYPKNELDALDYWTLTPKKYEADEARQLESLHQTGRYGPYVKEYIRKDGRLIPIQLNGMLINGRDGKKYIWSIVEDITERKFAEDRIRNLAFNDTLTQLPNRRLLNDRLGLTIATSRRTGQYAALMFLDLDNFKPLNDSYGHDVGDLLLIEAARRISSCVREVDTVARFGGDEFVVLISELDVDKAASIVQTGIIAEKIRTALAEPYLLTVSQDSKAGGSVEHHCTASIGVVLFNHCADLDRILRWADMAMYAAKEGGRNRVVIHHQDSSDAIAVNQDAAILHLNWHESYNCGDSTIDQEHRKLFELANTLIESTFTWNGNSEVFNSALEKLLAHVIQHFADEEAILAQHQYTDLEAHASAHKVLIERALRLRDQAAGDVTIGELVNFIVGDVIAKHMLKEDRKFYPLFKRAQSSQKK